jgi:hypothetical protein
MISQKNDGVDDIHVFFNQFEYLLCFQINKFENYFKETMEKLYNAVFENAEKTAYNINKHIYLQQGGKCGGLNVLNFIFDISISLC